MEQKRTSANTSVRKINRIYRILSSDPHMNGTTILDYGCGKFDDMKELAESSGYEWWGMDKYNRTEDYNKATEDRFDLEYPDIVICSNVLNVIDSDEEVENVIKKLSSMTGNVTKTFVTVWKKDKNGIGFETKNDCWQRNENVDSYVEKLSKHFKYVSKLKGESNIICCRN